MSRVWDVVCVAQAREGQGSGWEVSLVLPPFLTPGVLFFSLSRIPVIILDIKQISMHRQFIQIGGLHYVKKLFGQFLSDLSGLKEWRCPELWGCPLLWFCILPILSPILCDSKKHCIEFSSIHTSFPSSELHIVFEVNPERNIDDLSVRDQIL